MRREKSARAPVRVMHRLKCFAMIRLLFPARIARLNYLVRNFLFGAATWPLADPWEDAQKAPFALRDLWLALLSLALVAYWFVSIVRPRCRDAGMHWAWGFLIFLPFVNVVFALVLLFSRSTPTLASEQ